jgi:hypothetical protein
MLCYSMERTLFLYGKADNPLVQKALQSSQWACIVAIVSNQILISYPVLESPFRFQCGEFGDDIVKFDSLRARFRSNIIPIANIDRASVNLFLTNDCGGNSKIEECL